MPPMLFGLFDIRKPRGYHHPYIYVDERRERLEQLADEARRRLGMPSGKPQDTSRVRGKFVEATTHLKHRRRRKRQPLHVVVLLFFVTLLLYLWAVILSV